jgi:putative protease
MPTKKKTAKKAAKKPARKAASRAKAVKVRPEGKLIGKITHYFSNIEVAVIKLVAPLKKGDKIRVIGGQETDFEQKVGSMQIDYKDVKLAKKGSSIGMKVNEKIHEGYKVYKI